jgi:hypothetical protein
MNRPSELLAVVALTVCCFVVQAATAADGMSAPIGISQAEMRIRGVLQDKADLQFANQSLKDVLKVIKDKYQLDLQIDDATLNQLKSDVNAKRIAEQKDSKSTVPVLAFDPLATRIDFSAKGLTLRPVLNLILSQADLAAIIKDDVMLITTKDVANTTMITELYDVRDLVLRDNDLTGNADFDTLIDLIRSTLTPQSWDNSGGQGSVAGFSNGGICALVVWQNYDGQEQVEGLLTKLRSLRPQRILRQ